MAPIAGVGGFTGGIGAGGGGGGVLPNLSSSASGRATSNSRAAFDNSGWSVATGRASASQSPSVFPWMMIAAVAAGLVLLVVLQPRR
jgi:hypothetical protein